MPRKRVAAEPPKARKNAPKRTRIEEIENCLNVMERALEPIPMTEAELDGFKKALKRKPSTSVSEKLPKTSDEKLGPFVADDLDEEDDDGPDETATIET
jgi:hypothetical protein